MPARDKCQYFDIQYVNILQPLLVIIPRKTFHKVSIHSMTGISLKFMWHLKKKIKDLKLFWLCLFFPCDLKQNTSIQACCLSSLNCLSKTPGSLLEHRKEPCIFATSSAHCSVFMSAGRCILESWTWAEMIFQHHFLCLARAHTHTLARTHALLLSPHALMQVLPKVL